MGITLDEIYGFDGKVASFAISNEFVKGLSKMSYQFGKSLTPFCFYANKVQKEFGVTDLATFSGFTDPNMFVDTEIANYRKDRYKNSGIIVNCDDENSRKFLMYDYLMSISACYCEVPKYVTKDGLSQHTYDKFICTRNPQIMAAWMGTSASEMQAKYSHRIKLSQVEYGDREIRFVKLVNSGKGNTISVPRNSYNTDKFTCVPLFMLYAFIQGIKSVISENIVKFTFMKDNDTLREMPVTTSEDILRQYYSDNIYISSMLSGIDIETVQQGGIMLPSKISRGYIKVPEVGSSVYDATGVRSLNVARIVKAEIVNEVDRTFINVDLSSVVANFNNCIEYILEHSQEKMVDIYRAMLGTEAKDGLTPLTMATEVSKFCDTKNMILSTTFQRQLHLFLVQHPEWFPLYTGTPVAQVTSSKNFGVEMMDF